LPDGRERRFALPPEDGEIGDNVTQIVLTAPSGEQTVLDMAPALPATAGRGELRVRVLRDHIREGETVEATVAVTLPHAFQFTPGNRYVDTSDWFPYETESNFAAESVIGMAEWLDKPAGKHGYVQVDADRFVFEDGTPVKFWGQNVCVEKVAPPKEDAETWADKLAKHGVNLLRMHKFILHGTWKGGIGDKHDGMKLNEELARRWDYFCAELAERGIYTGWSHVFGFQLTPAMKDRVLAYDEIMAAELPWDYLNESTAGLVNFAPDLQELIIETTVNMLNRVNTVTGKRYAEDPSLAYIEFQNEDDIFWGATQAILDLCPTYQEMLNEQFSDWLKEKYDSPDKLAQAWGDDLAPDESLEERNIVAFAHPVGSGELPQRVLDNARFLHETQNDYYCRFAEAIRETGYKGALIGSCWQAGGGIGHYYNLQSDRMAGFIDRHNYFRGDRPMVSSPGSGLLSTGMQQLWDRPFGISEWAELSIWEAEAPAIIGIYGLGLQGWDMSCQFASKVPEIPNSARAGACDRLSQIAQYPTLARMVYRGDVKQGPVVSTRRVSMQELAEGSIGFEEKVELEGGWGNMKTFSGSVPQAALAAGRVVIEFADAPASEPLEQPRLDRYIRLNRQTVESATRQLVWNYSDEGYFTADTPGTKAVVGFAAGREHCLSEVTIRTTTPFAVIYVTSLDREKPIAEAGSLLVTALARTANTGALIEAAQLDVLRRGEPPLIIEPVKATISVHRPGTCRVHALDHEGRLAEEAPTVDVRRTDTGSRFTVDGAAHRTFYYLVEFAD